MSIIATRPSRRQPWVVLSLLLNLILLSCTALWWTGGIIGATLPGGFQLGSGGSGGGGAGAASVRLRPGLGAFAYDSCQRPQLDEEKLDEWGCKVFHRACFDQDTLLLHSGVKTPGHPNYTEAPAFEVDEVPPYVLPGYEESLGTAHYLPKKWFMHIRAPTHLDPPDVWQPAGFTNCTVPMVWWLTYFSIFADLFEGSALSLDAMLQEGAYDRNVTLAPVSIGLDLPPLYQSLLDPYTRFKVQGLSRLSSREHIATGQPRCFERVVLCNMVGMYISSRKHHWGELRPKTMGLRVVEHYRRKHPDIFRPYDEQVAREAGSVLHVAFQPRLRLRSIVNLKEVLEECKKWVPPAGTKFKSVDCVTLPDGSADNYAELVARVQAVHVLVNTHGSGNVLSFFLPDGGALVEILAWNFHGKDCTWADQYYRDWFELDASRPLAYFRLVADKDHVSPGPYERNSTGASWARDQDVRLDFPTLAKALEKVALGELTTTPANEEERTFFMTRADICEASKLAKAKEQSVQEQKEQQKAATKGAEAG